MPVEEDVDIDAIWAIVFVTEGWIQAVSKGIKCTRINQWNSDVWSTFEMEMDWVIVALEHDLFYWMYRWFVFIYVYRYMYIYVWL